MHTLLPETDGTFVAIRISDKLDQADYQSIVPILEERIAEHGKISLYWEMEQFEGWTAGGLWADTKFGVKHANDFRRIAVVGDKKWHEWSTKVMKPFTSAEVRYFNPDQRQQALAWAMAPEQAGSRL